MEGYGRWIALAIFLIWITACIISDFRKEGWSAFLPLLLIIVGLLVISLLVFIVNFW